MEGYFVPRADLLFGDSLNFKAKTHPQTTQTTNFSVGVYIRQTHQGPIVAFVGTQSQILYLVKMKLLDTTTVELSPDVIPKGR